MNLCLHFKSITSSTNPSKTTIVMARRPALYSISLSVVKARVTCCCIDTSKKMIEDTIPRASGTGFFSYCSPALLRSLPKRPLFLRESPKDSIALSVAKHAVIDTMIVWMRVKKWGWYNPLIPLLINKKSNGRTIGAPTITLRGIEWIADLSWAALQIWGSIEYRTKRSVSTGFKLIF